MMDNTSKTGVWVRSDGDYATSTPKRLKSIQNDSGIDSGSKLFAKTGEPASDGIRRRGGHHGILLRQASDVELSLSRPSPQKNYHSTLFDRHSPLKAIQARNSVTFDSLKKITPIKLRKCHTDPLFHKLCEELKKETGVTPKFPEKEENPFEPPNLAVRMGESWTSPNMFAQAPAETKEFKWSVHHLAELQPVDIDNKVDLLRTEILKHVHDDSEEENAQANILRFFNGICDVPSPTSHEPAVSMFADLEYDSLENSYERVRRVNQNPKDSECQTEIHIPPNFDFDKYFADFKIRMSQRRRTDSASSNDVRRKLFVEDEENEDEEHLDLNQSTGFILSTSPPPNRSSDFGVGFDMDIDFCLSSVEDDDANDN